MCRALTAEMDAALVECVASIDTERIAVVAVGGYGREELCLYSDIDVMLLHDGSIGAEQVRTALYPLWDAHLAVGHSVRTVREAAAASREHLETLSALLFARLLAGDAGLLAALEVELAGLLRRERARWPAAMLSAERERRRKEPFQLLAADLKNGRGGLRTFQTIDFERRRLELLGEPDPYPPSDDEKRARGIVLAVRNGLHAVSGRAVDIYQPELRAAVARWLGSDPHTVGGLLYPALRLGERLVDERWRDSGGHGDPVAAAGRWAVRALRSRVGRPDRRRLTEAGVSPALAAANATLQHAHGPVFTEQEEDLIRELPAPRWSDGDRTVLVRLLGGGARGRRIFERLVELGWVAKAIPEWSPVVAAPQLAPHHLHPVDTHLWRTVEELITISGADGDEPLCRQAADELGALDELMLAGCFHDIGKGLPGDHSETGAEITERFCLRSGFGAAVGATLAKVVRHHLLLPRAATRLDLDDPEVIGRIAHLTGDQHTLRFLYLLSVADGRATGPAMWNPWKASLVASLFMRTSEELAGRARPGRRPEAEADRIRAVRALAADPEQADAIEAHAARMPAGYLLRFDPEEILRHAALVTPPPQEGEVRLDVRHGAPASSVVVAAQDRPGLLSLVAGVLALHNVSVLDARFLTRSDGIVIDSLYVADGLGTGMVGKARWPAVRRDLTHALSGELDLEERLARKARDYRLGATAPAAPIRVSADHRVANGATVFEVRCPDRVGLLHDLGRALHEQGLDVHLAKIDTRGSDVVDVFHVQSSDGFPVRDAERVEAICAALRRAASPPADS